VIFDGTPFADRINDLANPTVTDVRKAKRGVYEALSDGAPRWTAYLVTAGADTLGAPASLDSLSMHFTGNPTEDDIAPDDPAIRYVRSRIAAMDAVSGLALSGVILPAQDADPQAPSQDREERWLRSGDKVTVGIKYGGGGSGVTLRLRRPVIAPAYMLADPDEGRWYLDVDLFSQDIGNMVLSVRARRALKEALTAFRRELYLASASLLGVVSEAAWYVAAEQLADLAPKLRRRSRGRRRPSSNGASPMSSGLTRSSPPRSPTSYSPTRRSFARSVTTACTPTRCGTTWSGSSRRKPAAC
jgi:hypothetical protein